MTRVTEHQPPSLLFNNKPLAEIVENLESMIFSQQGAAAGAMKIEGARKSGQSAPIDCISPIQQQMEEIMKKVNFLVHLRKHRQLEPAKRVRALLTL